MILDDGFRDKGSGSLWAVKLYDALSFPTWKMLFYKIFKTAVRTE